jgi:hypothetical protein
LAPRGEARGQSQARLRNEARCSSDGSPRGEVAREQLQTNYV